MSANVSLRGRLTISLLVLTGVVSALAVVIGMSILRGNVRTTAVEDLLLDQVGPSEDIFATGEIFEPALAADAVDSVVFADEFGEVFLDDFSGGLTEVNEFEMEYLTAVINQLGLYPELVESFADDDGRLVFWLSTGSFASLGSTGALDLQAEPSPDDVIVLASSVGDLGGSFFEAIDIDDIDGREFELLAESVNGRRYGVVAEVTDELRALDEVARALWVSAAVLSLAAGLAAWLLIGRALGPVNAITNRVSEISSGNLSDRVPVPPRQDEIGVLASTMNTMLGRLETSDLRRRQFISDASHELRTPVAVLQSEAEVATRAPDSTTVPDLSAVVLSESRRLGAMVEDLLSIARSDEGRSSTERLGEVDVDEVVLAESQRSRPVPVDRSAVSAGRVSGQFDDVSRTVVHLLDNAARHASAAVSVGVRSEGDEVVLWVDDDGPGIRPADRDRIFDRFVRLDDARNRDRGGAGLGLAVVRTTVEKMGGAVEVTDSPQGGARFTVRWPAASVD